MVYFLDVGSGHRIDEAQAVHFVAEELHPHGLVRSAQEHVDDIAVNPESTPLEIGLGPVVQCIHQLVQQAGKAPSLPLADFYGLSVEIFRIAYAVQAAYARNHYNVAPSAHQGRCGRQTEFFYLVVDAEVFLDICVGGRDVGLGLIVIVVRHEVLHRIGREERLEFTVQLGGKGLVVAQNKRRPLKALYDVSHGKRLARSRNAQKGNVGHAAAQSLAEPFYSLRLVSGGLVG